MSKQERWSKSSQPGWMAHWMRTSSNATAERLDESACPNKDLDRVSGDDHTTLEAPRSVKDPGKSEANLKGFGNEGMCSAPMEHGIAMNFKGGIQGVADTSMKPQERWFDKGKAVVSPQMSRPSIFFSNQVPDTKLSRIGQEHGQKHLHLESETCNQSELDASISARLGDGNTSSMDDQEHPRCGVDWLQKTQKCSHILSLLPSQSSETMRICTTVDSVEAPPRGIPWFCQTTHSLLITKKADANVLKETDIFRSLVTKMSGSSSSVLECVPPFFGQANRGVKLQPISSSNSEGQGNVGDTSIGASKHASKNESSAETDTMDMDLSEERLNFGANSARSTKHNIKTEFQIFSLDNNPSPRIDAVSSREVGRRRMSSGLPEINLELPALPAVASSSEDIPTSSRTQSLEMDILLVQAEQPEPKSQRSLDDSPNADPTTRWVKRLKLSSSETSAQGSKSWKLAEKLTNDKKRDFFRSILKKGIFTREQHGKDEHLPPDQPKKSKELLLSHVWIKRWLRNGSQISQRKTDTLVVCEPQSLKSPLDNLPEKQFPSIAAMALMGRAMSGFQSCELQKRGSFTIWNTSTL